MISKKNRRYFKGSGDGKAPLSRDPLSKAKECYDVIVIGSGLAGLSAANVLARAGRSVLLVEQHYNYGGMATWFKRRGGHVFDISLHGFPVGMKKTCRKYWNKAISDSIVQLESIRFDNPQFSFETDFTAEDFTSKLVSVFGLERKRVDGFFEEIRHMDFYDDAGETTAQLFQRHFPDRNDVHRLLMEPISYANGSTLQDPAITYGIVFSNFMSKGVFTFSGGTDLLIAEMKAELLRNGVHLFNKVQVDRIVIDKNRVQGIEAHGRFIAADTVLSNANLKTTIEKLIDPEHFTPDFLAKSKAVRLNNSSCQVYFGIREGESIPFVTDLLFTSTRPTFDSPSLCDLRGESRTFSFYYPKTRPGSNRYTIVSSTNANFEDWAKLDDEAYEIEKARLIEDTLESLERFVPDVRSKIDHLEAATPRTFRFYTQHQRGASFGTKFEGLDVSMNLSKQIEGLFHAGSVGIIMSGWLGAANYGVIQANKVDAFLHQPFEVNAVSFDGDSVIVTGGTRGLGRAIAGAFLQAGASVHATYRSDESSARSFKESCEAPDRLQLYRCDVTDADAVESLWNEIEEREPEGVQVLVSNAGIRRDAIVGMMALEDWEDVLKTNLTGTFLMCKHGVQNMMRRRYGRIVIVTSPASHYGFPGQANYSASKAGQIGMMRSLAREVAKRKITVNCVSPGFIETDLIADLPEEVKESHLGMVPMGRFGTPEEVASSVLFLASREASYIHGTTLEVTGGI